MTRKKEVNYSALVVNDQPLVRCALAKLLGEIDHPPARIVESAGMEATRAMMRDLRPKLILTEIRLQAELCFELIEWTVGKYADVRILVVSNLPEGVFAERALRAGADGFVSLMAGIEEIKTAIANVLTGEIYLSPNVERTIVHRVARNKQNGDLAVNPCAALSNRELHILHHLGNGLPPREIARKLDLSVKTVETYRDRLKDKLGLDSTFELMRYALEYQVFGTGSPH